MTNPKTSWGEFAGWYDQLLEYDADTYQRTVILPNLIRLLNVKKGEVVLDLACGQGFFTRAINKLGGWAIGIDISPELIRIAQKNSPKEIKFHVAPAANMSFLKNDSVQKIISVLAIQNIENIKVVFEECRRILKPAGKLLMVLNHPAFRIPQKSSWEWDEKNKIQYRRIDGYLSESKVKIQMHPGDQPKDYTLSFHRSLQTYFKNLKNVGFTVSGLEEWISNKKSQPGARAAAENSIRKEIPLFLFLEAIKK